jgi:hypothetical protein
MGTSWDSVSLPAAARVLNNIAESHSSRQFIESAATLNRIIDSDAYLS